MLTRSMSRLLFVCLVSFSAQYCSSQCDPPQMSTCSYTGLNRNCNIVIDRALPASPPTIYARYGSTITVTVINPSPFEQLSMDFSSAKIVIPTDTFQAFMAAQSGNLQKLSIVDLSQGRVAGNATLEDVLKQISSDQSKIFSDFDWGTFFTVLAQVTTTSIPPSACSDAGAYKPVAGQDPPSAPNPWYNLNDWKKTILNTIGTDPTGKLVPPAELKAKIKNLDDRISRVSEQIAALSPSDQSGLKPFLDVVTQNQSMLKARTELVSWVSQLSKVPPRTFPLTDISQGRNEWIQGSWNLNATSTAAALAKRVATTPYKPAQLGDVILNPTPKQSVAAVTVQYQSTPRLEFSTGLSVPVR